MISFEAAYRAGQIETQRGEIDPTLFVHADSPNGHARMTNVTLDGKTITAYATFVLVEPYEGLPCFQAGWAVPSAFRKQGRAAAIVQAAISEMRRGFARAGLPAFYIEAVVGENNAASRRVAERALSGEGKPIVDEGSGAPALQYFCKVLPKS
jgi:RimJ/RimL family protein N-acetyltransferase